MKTALHYVGVLALICAMAAGLLATVHEITSEPIASSRKRVTLEAVRTVLPPFETLADDETVKTIVTDPSAPEMAAAFSAGRLIGAAVKVTDPDGFGGDVTFMVGVTSDAKVHAIRLLAHKETPGLGTKLGDPIFTKQFQGLAIPAGGLRVHKDGGTIQAITGATISSRTATRAATRAVEHFEKVKNQLAQAASQAQPAQGGPRG